MLGCMRTTLTIDDDIAAQLRRLQSQRKVGLKALVNQALRAGLSSLEEPQPAPSSFQVQTFDCGSCLLGDLISVSETLAIAEGDWRR
jgi:hypothetical protein